ncbi:MAG: hypothetical protein M3Q07_03060 [Pseudobdellovibrionaceae bacterium]|nr:hypothetical protein [Pseudobdellovibrionaceae bacterium]
MTGKFREIAATVDDRQLAILFLAIYWAMVFPAMPVVGDAADYAASIRQGDFHTRTIHIGYNILVFPFVTVGSVLGLSSTISLNLLAGVCMAGSVAILHRLYLAIGCGRSTSTLACIVFGTAGIIWYHAEFGEVQALLTLLIVSCLYLAIQGHAVAAGCLFGFSLLVSQAAVPTAVCFPLIAYWKKSWEQFIKFGIFSGLAFLAGVAPIAQDYFWGSRGVVPSLTYYPSGSLFVSIVYFVYRIVENHTIWTVWFVVGLFVLYRQMPHILIVAGALWCSHLWLNLKLSHIEYGFAWMPFFIVSSLIAAIGAESMALSRRRTVLAEWTIPLCILVGFTLSSALYVLPKRTDAISLEGIVHEVRKRLGENTVLATPHVGFVYVYETDPAVSDVWQSSWEALPADSASWKRLMSTKLRVFVLLYKHQTHIFRRLVVDGPIARAFLSEAKRNQYREEGAGISESELRESLPMDFCLIVTATWSEAALFEVLINGSCQSSSHSPFQ